MKVFFFFNGNSEDRPRDLGPAEVPTTSQFLGLELSDFSRVPDPSLEARNCPPGPWRDGASSGEVRGGAGRGSARRCCVDMRLARGRRKRPPFPPYAAHSPPTLRGTTPIRGGPGSSEMSCAKGFLGLRFTLASTSRSCPLRFPPGLILISVRTRLMIAFENGARM